MNIIINNNSINNVSSIFKNICEYTLCNDLLLKILIDNKPNIFDKLQLGIDKEFEIIISDDSNIYRLICLFTGKNYEYQFIACYFDILHKYIINLNDLEELECPI